MRGCERRNGDGGVCGPTTSADNGIVSMSVVVLIPKPLDPLQKFKVISDNSETDDTMIDCGVNLLHFTFHKFLYENRLREGQARFANAETY